MCFFFNDTATTEIYTLSLHDALPIWGRWQPGLLGSLRPLRRRSARWQVLPARPPRAALPRSAGRSSRRSEEHTSELQSRQYLVCRLLLEKKNNIIIIYLLVVFILLLI